MITKKDIKPAGSIQYQGSSIHHPAFVNRLQTQIPLTNPSANKKRMAHYSKEDMPGSF